MNKKTWETPQLIILARGKPEETLTTGCKSIGTTIPGPGGNQQDGCNDPPGGNNCGTCQGRSGGNS